jgi:hypothetical protein
MITPELINTLKTLKDLGCVGIKISFEDEGAQHNEIISMRYLTALLGLELSIKVGGGEAKRDIVDCMHLNADIIVAPMVETNFALSKFLTILKNNGYTGKKGFNLETITSYNNLDTFEKSFEELDYIVFGRVDFVSSLGKDRSFVDTEEMYNYVSNVFSAAKKHDIKCCMGGAISNNSGEFIKKLVAENLLDKFETRYVIFESSKVDVNNFEQLILNATKFELEWLRHISNRYQEFANKDAKRIVMIENRFKQVSE